MSDPKVDGPLPTTDWQQPDPNQANTADRSFNDDVVSARVKMQEAAVARLAQDRLAHELPRDILALHQKVEKAGPFLPAGARGGEQRPRLRSEQEPARTRAQARSSGPATSDPLEFLEGRVGALMDQVVELEGQDPRGGEGRAEQMAAAGARAARLDRVDLQLRMHFQQLIAGQLGFRLLADPRLTFRRLFARIRRWPRRVRPGRMPESDQEFDDFLAWVFAPPPRPETIDEPFAVGGR